MIKHRRRFEQWTPAYFDGEFDWDFLLPAFNGTKISPMDIDAVVEMRGHKLIFETKIAGKKIDVGQARTLTSYWKDDGHSVLHLVGKTAPEITGYALYSGWETPKEGMIGDRKIIKADALDVLYITRRWFCKVQGISAQTREEWDSALWLLDHDGFFRRS